MGALLNAIRWVAVVAVAAAAGLIAAAIAFTLYLPLGLWRGFVAWQLWAWFAPAAGMPSVPFWPAIGLALAVSCAFQKPLSKEEMDKASARTKEARRADVLHTVGVGAIGPAVSLGLGALLRWAVL